FAGSDVDPQRAGRELHVATVLTGHFLKQGDNLMVTLEAIDVQHNRLLWQTTLTAPEQDLIALQNEMTAQMRQGLLPALGAAGGLLDTATRPKDKEAYDLYLHSLALPHDAAANKDAIAVLEHVVQADPNYAPAWEQLGLHYYYDSNYSDGGEAMFQLSYQAYERALKLDPNRIFAAGQLRRWSKGVRKVPRPISQCPTCIATPGCWSNPPRNVTRRWRSSRAITPTARAPGPSWNWARPSVPRTLSASTPARNGPLTSRRRFFCAKAKSRRPGRPSSRCQRLLAITVSSGRLACCTSSRRNWTTLSMRQSAACRSSPILKC